MVGGAQVLTLPVAELAVWRPELVLVLTALLSLAPLAWPDVRLRVPVLAGLAVATGLAATTLPVVPVAPLGPHFVVDRPAALVRLVAIALALVVQLELHPRDPRAGCLLTLAALGCALLAQAASLGGLLVATATTVLGGGLTAWFAGHRESRVAAGRWLAAAGLGFAVLAFAGVLWCGVAGTLELSALAPALAARPSLPPLALPLLLVLAGAGLALALLGDPDRYAAGGDTETAPALAAWLTVVPVLAVAAMAQRVVAGAELTPLLASAPTLTEAMAGILVVGGFVAATAQASLTRRLAWAATGQAGLALLGLVARPDAAVGGPALALLLAVAPAQLGAMMLAGALTPGRWREPQLLVLAGLLATLAALPPLVGWRSRLDLVAGLQEGGHGLGLAVAAVGSLLAMVVYLRPLVDLWSAPEPDTAAAGVVDARPSWAPALPTLIATALLAGTLAWGFGLIDPIAILP